MRSQGWTSAPLWLAALLLLLPLLAVPVASREAGTETWQALRDEARAIFPGAEVAHDLMELERPYED